MQRFAVTMITLSVLTACGGGGAGDETEEPSSPASSPSIQISETQSGEPTTRTPSSAPTASAESELEDAYRTYVEAFLTGDGATAYGLLSSRCRQATPLSEFAAASEAAAELYGSVDYKINRVEADGKKGLVDATFPVAALNNDEGGTPWVLEGGDWHSDRCG